MYTHTHTHTHTQLRLLHLHPTCYSEQEKLHLYFCCYWHAGVCVRVNLCVCCLCVCCVSVWCCMSVCKAQINSQTLTERTFIGSQSYSLLSVHSARNPCSCLLCFTWCVSLTLTCTQTLSVIANFQCIRGVCVCVCLICESISH